MTNRIDEILAICDRVFGPDDNGPTFNYLPGYGTEEHHRPNPTPVRIPNGRLVSRFSTPEEIFGPVSLDQLRRECDYYATRRRGFSVREIDFVKAKTLAIQGGGKLCNNTYVSLIETGFGVTLHSTMIYEYDVDEKTLTLNAGAWQTVTTKQRLNRLLKDHGYRIEQRDYVWYVVSFINSAAYASGEAPFEERFHNGMTISLRQSQESN